MENVRGRPRQKIDGLLRGRLVATRLNRAVAGAKAGAVAGVPHFEPKPAPGASAGDKSDFAGQQMITTSFISLHFLF